MFDKAFNDLMVLEGDYCNNTSDRGGATRFGITEATARQNGSNSDIKDLPLETAKAIYNKCYWDTMQLDNISSLSYDIAYQLFQCGVNQGVGTAVKMLQRALNFYQMKGSELTIDGFMGKQTFGSLKVCIEGFNYQNEILLMLKAQQIMRYMEIVESDNSQAIFLKGWLNRVKL